MYLLLAKLLLCFLLFIQHKNEIWHLKACQWSVKKLKGNKLLRVWQFYNLRARLYWTGWKWSRCDAFNFTHEWVVFKGGDGVHYIKHHVFLCELTKIHPKQVVTIYITLFKIDYYWDIVLL